MTDGFNPPIENVRQLSDMGKLEYEAGRYAAAEKYFEEACRLCEEGDDPNLLVVVRSHLGSVRKMLGDKPGALAIESWLVAFATDPATNGRVNDDYALRTLAASFTGFTDVARQLPQASLEDLLGILREGEAWLSRIGRMDWTADIRLQRALILDARKEKLEARREMERAVALKRRKPRVTGFFSLETHLFQLAELLTDEPFCEYHTALNLTEEVIQYPGTNFFELRNAYRIRSRCREGLGDLVTAEQDARQLVALCAQSDLKSDRVEGFMVLGRILGKRERQDEAVAVFREALALISEDEEGFPMLANSLAWAQYSFGIDLDEPEKLAYRAMRKQKDNIHIQQTLAAILVRQNKWDESMELIREWATHVEERDVISQWHDFVLLFQDAVKYGHAEALTGLLGGDLWGPMRLALARTEPSEVTLPEVPESLTVVVATLLSQIRRENVPLRYPITTPRPYAN